MPSEYVEEDEVAIDDTVQFSIWSSKMTERLDNSSSKLGWTYQVSAVALSKSPRFPFIFRAKLHWIVDGEPIKSIEFIWEDPEGRCGMGSAILG